MEPDQRWLTRGGESGENLPPSVFSAEDHFLSDCYTDGLAGALGNLLPSSSSWTNSDLRFLPSPDLHRLETVLSCLSDGIFLLDSRCRVTYANSSALSVLAVPFEEIVGRPIRETIERVPLDGLAWDGFLKQLEQVVQFGEKCEQELDLASGSCRRMLVTASPLLDSWKRIIGGVVVVREVTEVVRLQSQLRRLLAHAFHVQEEERRRIAVDTHDGALQFVIGSLYEVQALRASASDPGTLDARLRIIEGLLDEAVTEMRRVINNLRPPVLERTDLVQAIRYQVSDHQQMRGVHCTLEVRGSRFRLPMEKELAVFRIVQEALQNVRKHAGATVVKIVIDFSPRRVRVLVRDNGRSFDETQESENFVGHLGLTTMRERARSIGAKLSIETEPGRGTTLILEVPVCPGLAGSSVAGSWE